MIHKLFMLQVIRCGSHAQPEVADGEAAFRNGGSLQGDRGCPSRVRMGQRGGLRPRRGAGSLLLAAARQNIVIEML